MRDKVESLSLEPRVAFKTNNDWKPLRYVPEVIAYVPTKPKYETLARNLDR